MKRIAWFGLALYLLTVGQPALFASKKNDGPRVKKRIAVFVFADKTDKSWRWWNNKGVGQGISDMLTTALVKTGNYRVIERAELDKILDEQDLGNSGIVTPESAAKVGQVLGVELAVLGSVTEFGYKKSKTGGRIKGYGLAVQSQSATIALDCRFVNTSTGEILSAESVRKEKSSKGIKVDTRKIHFESQKKFDESLVGKATRDAVKRVIQLIDESAPLIPWQAKVVTERDGKVFINAGAQAGIRAGDRFVIYRKGEELIDPDTGLTLGSVDSKIGMIEVTDPDVGAGKASECRIVDGSGFGRGDFVRLK